MLETQAYLASMLLLSTHILINKPWLLSPNMANLIMMGDLGRRWVGCAKCEVVVSNEQTLECSQPFGTFFGFIKGWARRRTKGC
jgi:hypothetical protein